jgi:L-alanine-DL-glutamate epimerase-like enolase superfamily enzyme
MPAAATTTRKQDEERLSDEIRQFVDLGYTHAKIKIGDGPLARDLRRIEAAARLLADSDHLAVDAIYAYELESSLAAAAALSPYRLWWFEDQVMGWTVARQTG